MSTLPPNSRNLLSKCLLISVGLHAVGILVFYTHPNLFQPAPHPFFSFSPTTPKVLQQQEPMLTLEEKNQMLEEAFDEILLASSHFQHPLDLVELPEHHPRAPKVESSFLLEPQAEDPEVLPEELVFTLPIAETIAMTEQEIPSPSLLAESMPLAENHQIDLLSAIAEPDLSSLTIAPSTDEGYQDFVKGGEIALLFASPSEEKEQSAAVFAQSMEPLIEDPQIRVDASYAMPAQPSTSDPFTSDLLRPTLFVSKQTVRLPEVQTIDSPFATNEIDYYNFPEFALATTWNDHFEMDVKFLPHPDGQGYIFSIALTAADYMNSHAERQNIYFILDRSSALEKHRFGIFKRAALKALSSLKQGDLFNIFLVDKKVTRFSPTNLAVSVKNIRAAEEFLSKESGGGLFASGNIYASLEKILEQIQEPEEVHTAILFSDGKVSQNTKAQREALERWVKKNNGRLTVYTAASGRDNDLLSLDLLSSVSGGRLVYSDTHASLARKVGKIVLDVRDPLVNELSIAAYPHHPQARIALYPPSSQLPPFYTKQPYMLIGEIDHPCSFDLMIRGRNKEEWISVKKEVSFAKGQKADSKLSKQWQEVGATIAYRKFLAEGKKSHLKDAKESLQKARSEVAWE